MLALWNIARSRSLVGASAAASFAVATAAGTTRPAAAEEAKDGYMKSNPVSPPTRRSRQAPGSGKEVAVAVVDAVVTVMRRRRFGCMGINA